MPPLPLSSQTGPATPVSGLKLSWARSFFLEVLAQAHPELTPSLTCCFSVQFHSRAPVTKLLCYCVILFCSFCFFDKSLDLLINCNYLFFVVPKHVYNDCFMFFLKFVNSNFCVLVFVCLFCFLNYGSHFLVSCSFYLFFNDARSMPVQILFLFCILLINRK